MTMADSLDVNPTNGCATLTYQRVPNVGNLKKTVIAKHGTLTKRESTQTASDGLALKSMANSENFHI
jgi:hypothetical protein